MAKKAAVPKSPKSRIGVIFSEDANDAVSLKNLGAAIWPGIPRVDHCRRPLILMRDRRLAEDRRRNASDVRDVLSAKQVDANVEFVVAHQDCDAVEPAHETLARTIREELAAQGLVSVIAVAPAWEIEAWWYLWPAAVAAVNSKWTKLKRTGNHGMITNAKEALRRDLRAVGAVDYEESDSRRISLKIKELNLIDNQTGTSNSFASFRRELEAIAFRPRRTVAVL